MSKLRDVNTTDLKSDIAPGCRTTQRVFNADDREVPFFGSTIVPRRVHEQTGLTFHELTCEAHVAGRHPNALLNAEASAGIELDEEAVAKHARTAFLSFCGPCPCR